jgi:peptide/nickel transport system ATP-binding protein
MTPEVLPSLPLAADASPILEAIGLSKTFSTGGAFRLGSTLSVKAVEPLDLALYSGKVLALVGESGSGKTTVARVLAGMYPPTGGVIKYKGVPINLSHRVPKEHHRHVQLVFQDPFGSLNPAHSVRYHLNRPLHIFGHVHSREQEQEQILDLLRRVSLTPAEQFIEKFPHELSGGQRQRIAIARALAARPNVLLADEPVSMLDVSIRLDMLNLLAGLRDDLGLALLFITHDIATARYFADNIMVMYAGQLVESGPAEVVMRTPKHPYTQLLLSAAPDPSRLHAKGRKGIVDLPARGEPPSLIHPPTGCRFHPRCPHKMPICTEKYPTRTELGGGHFTHCFLYGGAPDSPHVAAPVPFTSLNTGETA